MDLQNIDHLIRHRRSIKPPAFNGEKIPDALVWELLENANWAPNHGNTEPWRFEVFTDTALASLAKFKSEAYRSHYTEKDFSNSKYQKLATMALKSSHVIAILMKRQGSERIPEVEEILAVGCAMQNFHLSAVAHGLAGYWMSGFPTFHPAGKEFFSLGEKDLLLGFFYLGKTDEANPKGLRGPIGEKVTWHS